MMGGPRKTIASGSNLMLYALYESFKNEMHVSGDSETIKFISLRKPYFDIIIDAKYMKEVAAYRKLAQQFKNEFMEYVPYVPYAPWTLSFKRRPLQHAQYSLLFYNDEYSICVTAPQRRLKNKICVDESDLISGENDPFIAYYSRRKTLEEKLSAGVISPTYVYHMLVEGDDNAKHDMYVEYMYSLAKPVIHFKDCASMTHAKTLEVQTKDNVITWVLSNGAEISFSQIEDTHSHCQRLQIVLEKYWDYMKIRL